MPAKPALSEPKVDSALGQKLRVESLERFAPRPGAPNTLIGGLLAACLGDTPIRIGPPDVIAMGAPTVLFCERPAARMGDTTAHGGTIVLGFPTVLVG